jgi:hypothetical protein
MTLQRSQFYVNFVLTTAHLVDDEPHLLLQLEDLALVASLPLLELSRDCVHFFS